MRTGDARKTVGFLIDRNAKGGAPCTSGCFSNLETVLDDEILEQKAKKAVVGPAVIDGGELEENEGGVEYGEPN